MQLLPSLPMPSKTSLPMSASAALHSERGLRHPHDPCRPATENDEGGKGGVSVGVVESEVSRSAVTEFRRTDSGQGVGSSGGFACRRREEKGKVVASVYFWACACRRTINNGWAQRLGSAAEATGEGTPCMLGKTKHADIQKAMDKDNITASGWHINFILSSRQYLFLFTSNNALAEGGRHLGPTKWVEMHQSGFSGR